MGYNSNLVNLRVLTMKNTRPEIFVFDTNIFFNLEANTGLGNNPGQIMESLFNYGKHIGKERVLFYMPPSIVDEIYTFISRDDSTFKKLISIINVKAPDKSQILFSVEVFYTLIQDVRQRSYRGLTIAEEEIHNAVSSMTGNKLDRIEFQKEIGKHITKLRDRYRNATRTKFLDSVADLDIIVLAKELNGHVVSADEGIHRWAREFGVHEVQPMFLSERLETLLHQASKS